VIEFHHKKEKRKTLIKLENISQAILELIFHISALTLDEIQIVLRFLVNQTTTVSRGNTISPLAHKGMCVCVCVCVLRGMGTVIEFI
jgi:hypothetical protein